MNQPRRGNEHKHIQGQDQIQNNPAGASRGVEWKSDEDQQDEHGFHGQEWSEKWSELTGDLEKVVREAVLVSSILKLHAGCIWGVQISILIPGLTGDRTRLVCRSQQFLTSDY